MFLKCRKGVDALRFFFSFLGVDPSQGRDVMVCVWYVCGMCVACVCTLCVNKVIPKVKWCAAYTYEEEDTCVI